MTTKSNKLQSGEPDNNFEWDKWSQVKATHEILDRPDRFAEYFDAVSTSQSKIKEVFRRELLEFLRTNVEGREEIKKMIREVDKEDRWSLFRKFGLGVWSLLLAVGSAVVGAIITKIVGQ